MSNEKLAELVNAAHMAVTGIKDDSSVRIRTIILHQIITYTLMQLSPKDDDIELVEIAISNHLRYCEKCNE